MAGEVFRRRWDFTAPIQRFFAMRSAASAADGVAAVTIAAAAALLGAGALAGTCSLTLSGSAAPVGGSQLTGSLPVTIGAQATATAEGALSGSAVLVFGETANVQNTGYGLSMRLTSRRLVPQPEMSWRHYDRLVIFNYVQPTGVVGQADILFGGNGLLLASGRLQATTPIQIAATGTLAASGALAGSAAITITPSAPLVSGASGSVAGSLAFSFDGAGTLTGAGKLLGVAEAQFDATGISAQIVSISGSTSLQWSLGGSIEDLPEFSTDPVRSIRFQIRGPSIRFEFV